MTTVLSVTSAFKTFGQTTALDGAGLVLHERQWLGLLGPNGAGKTTLIRAIAGRVTLDQGEITLLGRSLNAASASDPAARRKLGIVPQEIAVYPLLTARENLEVFGALHGLSGEQLRDRVQWGLQWTGLADRAADQTKNFSGGMKRRLNIACGVLHQPPVVLLDEPTVGVDPQSRQRIWEMLASLRDEGAALLLTTHQLDEAQQLCDRIVIIDHGRTIADGTLDELVAATVGRGRRVTVSLDRPLPPGSLDAQVELKDSAVHCRIDDVAGELPSLLERIRRTGAGVTDLRVEPPSLHAVFLHLTGRELRDD